MEVTTDVTIRVGGAAVVVVVVAVVVVDVVFGGDVTAGVDASATVFGFSSDFSSEGATRPTIMRSAKTAATIHGHFRFFFGGCPYGDPPVGRSQLSGMENCCVMRMKTFRKGNEKRCYQRLPHRSEPFTHLYR
ncbi:hypothetical protein [Williamsia muralis]|uniref:hypothetical protein n=1 Tax=Williamsia marianensis TaxID=85044 RepID=UPI0014026B7D|nr:hypothetical protein [Williamsia marianensis]